MFAVVTSGKQSKCRRTRFTLQIQYYTCQPLVELWESFVAVTPKPGQAAASCGNTELFGNLGTLSLGMTMRLRGRGNCDISVVFPYPSLTRS